LLNYLHAKFLRKVPWEAQADLLLSELYRPIGYEMYAMEPALREYLLAEMEKTESAAKMQEVAHLILSYVRHLWHTHSLASASELQAQRWGAMAYITNERENVIQEMAKSFQSSINNNDQAEISWLLRLTKTFEPQLKKSQNYPTIYAQ
jgi:hypothetical protein